MSSWLRSLVVPALCTALMATLLVGLGIWQLHRLSWKEGILARIEARTKAPVQSLPLRGDWSALKPEDYEYRRVSLDGTFLDGKTALVFHNAPDGPGYLVMTPLRLKEGGTVIVNRGYVPSARKDVAVRPEGRDQEAHVTGLMRQPEPRNLFTPADDIDTGIFFTRDPLAIARFDHLSDTAPFTVDADATPNESGWPRGGTTELAIPNNHLSYALTWFGLAAGLLGVFFSFAWKRFASTRVPADEVHSLNA